MGRAVVYVPAGQSTTGKLPPGLPAKSSWDARVPSGERRERKRYRSRRAEWYRSPQSFGAIACYARAGFCHEGTLREARRHGEEYWTISVMSILEHEWDVNAVFEGDD